MSWHKSTRCRREAFLVATSQLWINSQHAQQGEGGYVTTLAQQRWEKGMMGMIKMKDAEADERKRKGMNFITSNISLKCSVNRSNVSLWWIIEQQQERRKTGWDWLHGVMMKQTKWEFNYRAAIDSGCTDDGGKIPAILKWDHAVIESAQKQAQGGFLPQQELLLLEELAKKKK